MRRYIDLDHIEFLKVDGNKEFNHGVDCCVNRLLAEKPIEAIPIEKVKKAREEIEELATEQIQVYDEENPYISGVVDYVSLIEVRELLDKLIESEE